MMPVTKPALLRQIFSLAVSHPAEVLSYQKMLGQLQDAGNTTTVVSYLKLLSNAFLVTPLAFISAMSGRNYSKIKKDPVFWGRIVKNAVGAKLYTLVQEKGYSLFYWRGRDEEVDYIINTGMRNLY